VNASIIAHPRGRDWFQAHKYQTFWSTVTDKSSRETRSTADPQSYSWSFPGAVVIVGSKHDVAGNDGISTIFFLNVSRQPFPSSRKQTLASLSLVVFLTKNNKLFQRYHERTCSCEWLVLNDVYDGRNLEKNVAAETIFTSSSQAESRFIIHTPSTNIIMTAFSFWALARHPVLLVYCSKLLCQFFFLHDVIALPDTLLATVE